MPKKINVSLYLDRELHEKLRAMAEDQTRKLSNMIEHLLRKATEK